ncbi:MAG: DUF721 domain-containing protein [Verrucomicrobiota bacterium]|jgi:hypothetical protein
MGPGKSTARERILAQWRGLDLAPLEKIARNPARSAADLIPGVLKGLRMDGRRSEAEIVKVWNELLPPDIVAHAQPASYNKGTLFVNVDSSVWLSEIVRYRRLEIIERLRHSFGAAVIKKVSFRLG